MDLDRLTNNLRSSGKDRLDLSFEQIEQILGAPLPPSARKHQAWWSNTGHAHARAWKDAGFKTTFAGTPPSHIAFVRNRGASAGQRTARPQARRGHEPWSAGAGSTYARSDVDAMLVGCVATKAPAPAPAKDLYRSQLFTRRRAYAEASGKPWFILSALHGLVQPDEVTEPYDLNMT